MYEVPIEVDLSRFKDAVLIQLCIEFQVDLLFHPKGSISLEGK